MNVIINISEEAMETLKARTEEETDQNAVLKAIQFTIDNY